MVWLNARATAWVYFGYPRPHELSCAINKGEADRGEGAAAVGIASRALIGRDGVAHRKAIGSSEAGGDLGVPQCVTTAFTMSNHGGQGR